MTVARGLIVPCIVNPVLAIFLLPFSIGIYVVFGYFKNIASQTERLTSISRSSLLVCAKSTVDGLSTIRGSNMSGLLTREFHKKTDNHSRPGLSRIAAQRWFGLRVDLICFVYSVLAVFGSIFLRGKLS